MTKSLVSIIVPVYNVEKYLSRCIDSVVGQTYENMEIILVDDGSTDGCAAICDKYKEADKRVIVVHQKNGGLSKARNTGIEKAKGKYLMFVDSDDKMPLYAVETLLDVAVVTGADIVNGGIKKVHSDQQTYDEKKKGSYTISDSERAMEKQFYRIGGNSSASGKIYKKHLFDDIRYPVGKNYEDLGTTYKVLARCNKVAYVKSNVYYYYQNEGSIMHTKYNKSRLDSIVFAEEAVDFVKEKYPRIQKSAEYRLLYECLYAVSQMPLLCGDRKGVYKKIKALRNKVLKDRNLLLKQKITIFSSYFGILGVKFAFWTRRLKERIG